MEGNGILSKIGEKKYGPMEDTQFESVYPQSDIKHRRISIGNADGSPGRLGMMFYGDLPEELKGQPVHFHRRWENEGTLTIDTITLTFDGYEPFESVAKYRVKPGK